MFGLVTVSTNSTFVFGLIAPRTAKLDHAYVEIQLGGDWIGFDSFIVDLPLFRAARDRLQTENLSFGYGICRSGSPVFPGFVQFVDGTGVRGREWGAFESISAFYRSEHPAWNRIPWYVRPFLGSVFAAATAHAAALRDTG